MKLEVHALSDRGLVKDKNEDIALLGAYLIRDNSWQGKFTERDLNLFAVADGVGGAEGGEIASEMVVKSLSDFMVSREGEKSAKEKADDIKDWAAIMNRMIVAKAQTTGWNGMGTTLTGLSFDGEHILMFNAGDSRIYRYRDGILRKMTRDHSLRDLTGNKEVPTNIMYNAFGKREGFFIDVEDITTKVRNQDLFLICSDGLNDMISDSEIEECLINENSASLLCEKAKIKGGKDNITYILLKILSD